MVLKGAAAQKTLPGSFIHTSTSGCHVVVDIIIIIINDSFIIVHTITTIYVIQNYYL